MKRDMELVRKMLLDLEDDGKRAQEHLTSDDDSEAQFKYGYHAYLLHDAGLIHAVDSSYLGCPLPQFIPCYLNWAGHEFLDAARDEGRWIKAKDMCASVGGFTVSILKEILTSLLKQQVGL